MFGRKGRQARFLAGIHIDSAQLIERLRLFEGCAPLLADSEVTGAMKMNEELTADEPHWVLVEGPRPGDAEFLGRWLLATKPQPKATDRQT
jgi:hypothetical protein